MIYLAKVEDGIVTQVITAKDTVDLPDYIYIGTENIVGVGWTYEDDEFYPPVHEETEE